MGVHLILQTLTPLPSTRATYLRCGYLALAHQRRVQTLLMVVLIQKDWLGFKALMASWRMEAARPLRCQRVASAGTGLEKVGSEILLRIKIFAGI